MTTTTDVVVAGGGHNSLVTAAYLAKAGYECIVLEARSVPGGGAVTEELLLPGYRFDTCSTGHTLLQANPLIRDELIEPHPDLAEPWRGFRGGGGGGCP